MPSLSAKPTKTTKRTRVVSTLTPSQLARKRANDREAQRAIRAQTKEHIKQLEREIEELKSKQNQNNTIQDLLRQNKALEDEVNQLTEIAIAPSHYSTPVFYNNPTSGSGAVPSPSASPFPFIYNSLPYYSQQYVPLPNDYESRVNIVMDNYNAGHIPMSVSTSMVPSNNSNTDFNSLPHKDVKIDYGDVENHGIEPYGLRRPEETNHRAYPETGFLFGDLTMPSPHPSSSV